MEQVKEADLRNVPRLDHQAFSCPGDEPVELSTNHPVYFVRFNLRSLLVQDAGLLGIEEILHRVWLVVAHLGAVLGNI